MAAAAAAPPPGDERRYKLAEVSEDSRDGWRDLAAHIGCTPTALAEVIGLHMRGRTPEDPTFGPFMRSVVDQARALTEERRRRDIPET